MKKTISFPSTSTNASITPIAKLQNTFTISLVISAKKMRLQSILKTFVLYFCGFLILLVAFFTSKNTSFNFIILVLVFFCAFLIIIMLILNFIATQKQFETEKKLIDKPTDYVFYSSYFAITKPQPKPKNKIQAYAQAAFPENKIFYTNLKKIVDTQNILYLYTNSTTCFAVPKTGFTQNTPEGLQTFFKTTYPLLKYQIKK